MPEKSNSASRSVLIATDTAEQYRSILCTGLEMALDITVAESPKQVLDAYSSQPVILGRPDYLVALMQTGPPVKWLQSTWAGVTPLTRLPFRGYLLTGVKEVFGPLMSEYVFAYLLAHEVRLRARWQDQQRQTWNESPNGTLKNKVLGVMGTGSIGRCLAATARHFGMQSCGLNTRGKPTDPFDIVYSKKALWQFLECCDYVVSVLPDTPDTSNLLNDAAIRRLRSSAVLINAGRGNVIDDEALCRALTEGRLAGAVLDVFRQEPLPADSPLWATPNLHITGHVAAVSRPEDIGRLFIENYRRFVRGEPLQHVVDFDKGY